MGNFRYPSEGSNGQFGAFATGFLLLYVLPCSFRYRHRVTDVVAQLDRGAERRILFRPRPRWRARLLHRLSPSSMSQ